MGIREKKGLVHMKKPSDMIEGYFLRVCEGVIYRGYLAKIPNSLKAEQDYVDGAIETFTLNDDFALICDRDGVIMGKPLNRALYDERGKFRTVFAGNLMVVRHKIDIFASIHEKDVAVIEKLLKPIERIACGIVFLKEAEELPEWKGEADEPDD